MSSCNVFYAVTFEQVYQYVVWHVMHDTFFTLHIVLSRQDLKGVPIGGFL